MAEVRYEIGNEVFLAVRVDQRKNSAGHGHERQIIFRAFGKILHHVGQKFQLFDQVWIFWRVDLGEFHFEKRQFLMHAPQNLRRDLRRAVMNKFYNLGHGGSLTEQPEKYKSQARHVWGTNQFLRTAPNSCGAAVEGKPTASAVGRGMSNRSREAAKGDFLRTQFCRP